MDAEAYPQEVLADEEPRYLRRQKPLEIKRRKFGRKAWKTYLQVFLWSVVGVAAAAGAYFIGNFLFTSREMALIHPEQVAVSGNHYVQRTSVLELFAVDRGRSVLRIPLDERRRQLEAISWVEQATVRRALPNRIEVEIVEREPIAFLRQASELSLVDAHGVILERPLKGKFHFPVVTGINAEMPQDEREKRMQLYAGFAQQLEAARAGAMEQVSEVDLADENDVRATLMGLQPDAPVLVHFGENDFENKYRSLVENIGKWRATTGRLDSIDLRFSGEAVANPDTTAVAQERTQGHASSTAPTRRPGATQPAQPAKRAGTKQSR